MYAALGTFLLSLTSSLVARVLTSLGMGTLSFVGLSALVDSMILKINTAYSLIDPAILSIMNLSGFGTVISIFSASLVVKVSFIAIKRLAVV